MVEPMHAEFAQRLQAAAHKKMGDNNDATITAISEVAKVSYEAARKYWNGLAKPRTPKLILIADWLGIPPHELEYGPVATTRQHPATTQREITHTDALGEAIRALEEAYQSRSLDDDALKAFSSLFKSLNKHPPTGDMITDNTPSAANSLRQLASKPK